MSRAAHNSLDRNGSNRRQLKVTPQVTLRRVMGRYAPAPGAPCGAVERGEGLVSPLFRLQTCRRSWLSVPRGQGGHTLASIPDTVLSLAPSRCTMPGCL